MLTFWNIPAILRDLTQLVQAATAMDTIRRRAEICNTDSSSVFAVGFLRADIYAALRLPKYPSDFAPVKGLNFLPTRIVLCYAVIGGRPNAYLSFEAFWAVTESPAGDRLARFAHIGAQGKSACLSLVDGGG
ncbi:MAG: hypothetical protein ACLRSW_12625 [Christensenellaceae bacterium]